MNLSASLSSYRFCIFAVTLPKKCVLSASYSLQFARKCISSSMTLHTGHSRLHMLVLGFVYLPRSTSNVCEQERNFQIQFNSKKIFIASHIELRHTINKYDSKYNKCIWRKLAESVSVQSC